MTRTNKDENAKNTQWKTPVDLPGVKPQDYSTEKEDAKRSSVSAELPVRGTDQSGTKGFNRQLAGNGIAGENNTSSFNADPESYKTSVDDQEKPVTRGKEEHGTKQHSTTSAAGRILPHES